MAIPLKVPGYDEVNLSFIYLKAATAYYNISVNQLTAIVNNTPFPVISLRIKSMNIEIRAEIPGVARDSR
jgi:hypothetical protein